MPLADNLPEWRLSVIANLVWTVLPVRERAKSWEDVGAAAVYEYERNLDAFQESDENFQVNSDKFINKNYICNKRTEIRRQLEQRGDFIGNVEGRGEGTIYRIEHEADLERMLITRQNRIMGQVNAYNDSVRMLQATKPQFAFAMPEFEKVKQLSDNDGIAPEIDTTA